MTDLDTLTRPPISEKQLMAAVMDLAQWLGYLVYHPFDSGRSTPGFPDCVLVRRPGHGPPRLLFVELKSQRGRLRHGQADWSAALRAAGAEYWCFRPEDWHSGTVERILSGPGARYGTMLPASEQA